jgi:hypothetical protein
MNPGSVTYIDRGAAQLEDDTTSTGDKDGIGCES